MKIIANEVAMPRHPRSWMHKNEISQLETITPSQYPSGFQILADEDAWKRFPEVCELSGRQEIRQGTKTSKGHCTAKKN
jgi:hypothetical protein